MNDKAHYSRQEATDNIRRMDITEFRALGILQELNRQFLHPLGLALETVVEEDGSEHLGGVWDYRDDAEGMLFADGVISQDKADSVAAMRQAHEAKRTELMGSVIQPVRR